MFHSPKREGEAEFCVELVSPRPLNVRVYVDDKGVRPTLEYQNVFESLRHFVLSDLVSNTKLFRTAPSISTLETITPPWGFVSTQQGAIVSPYTIINIGNANEPYFGDIVLKTIHVSRSCIRPEFDIVWLESATDLIDFDWTSPVEEDITEISDLPQDAGMLTLVDPVLRERERVAEKENIRKLFSEARAASDRYFEKYNLSEDSSENDES